MGLMRGVTACQETERENEQTRRFIWTGAERERERAGSLALGRDVRWHGGDSCVPRSGRGAD